jgi:anti-sigma-28 factor FlgM
MKINTITDQAQLDQLMRADRKSPNGAKSGKNAQSDKVVKDTVDISGEGKVQENIAKYVKIVKNMDDVRPEAIESAKAKIKSGEYDDLEVYRRTAENILDE